MLLIEKINSFVFLKIGPKTVFLGKKRCLQIFLGKIFSMIAPKQNFFVTGIIELTPKTLQNYGFVNIGLTPPPLFPNPTTPVDLMTKEWYWEGVKKTGTAGNEQVF